MQKNLKYVFAICLMLVFPLSALAEKQDMQPDEMVRRTVSGVIDQLKANKSVYDADHNKLFAMVDERILPYFDFRKMSQLVLGPNWRKADENQRNEFVSEFKSLLVRTYAIALLKYTDQTMEYMPYTGKPTDKVVTVKANVKQGGGSPDIPVFTRFYNGKNGWKVIDVSIEGISLVTNYRNVYNETIKKEGLDKLIKSIAETNRKAGQSRNS